MPEPDGGAPEHLDIVDATGRPLGSAPRDQVHRDGLWHPVFHCLIVRSGRPARVVLQRRSRSKAAFPGRLDLSATGHLTAGEAPLDGIRELTEELGIEVERDRLVPIGVRLLADDQGGEGRNRERVHLYLLADDRPLESYVPADGELDAVVEVPVEELLAVIDGRLDRVAAIEFRPGRGTETIDVTAADLVASIDGYWTVALVMAGRFADGLGPLAI